MFTKSPGFTQHLFSKAHVAPEGPGLKVGGKSSVLSHKLGSEAASLFFGQGPFLAGWITHFTGGPRTIAVAGKRLPVSIRAAQDLCREGKKAASHFRLLEVDPEIAAASVRFQPLTLVAELSSAPLAEYPGRWFWRWRDA